MDDHHTEKTYPRDLTGYADTPPRADWPAGARLALQIVLNYEEGAENCILHGDAASEAQLCELGGAVPWQGERHMTVESQYEYGSRVGVWRLLDLFRRKGLPVTIFASGMAMERNPRVIEVMLRDGHEICNHGYRWIDYQWVSPEVEREHMQRSIAVQERLTGARPLGWYTGRASVHTRRLVVEEGGFLYDADAYSDDLPFWTQVAGRPHLVIPYTMDTNDQRFGMPQGFSTGVDFFNYLKDSFDVLYAESVHTPRMMSVGLHCRVAGRPGRFAAVERFVDYALRHEEVWLCRRVDIARHWIARHPFSVESAARNASCIS